MGNYQQTDTNCPHCEDGILYKDGVERFCGTCFWTNTERSTKTSDQSVWDSFQQDRPTYHTNDDVKKCIGGFLEPYEWSETDGLIQY